MQSDDELPDHGSPGTSSRNEGKAIASPTRTAVLDALGAHLEADNAAL